MRFCSISTSYLLQKFQLAYTPLFLLARIIHWTASSNGLLKFRRHTRCTCSSEAALCGDGCSASGSSGPAATADRLCRAARPAAGRPHGLGLLPPVQVCTAFRHLVVSFTRIWHVRQTSGHALPARLPAAAVCRSGDRATFTRIQRPVNLSPMQAAAAAAAIPAGAAGGRVSGRDALRRRPGGGSSHGVSHLCIQHYVLTLLPHRAHPAPSPCSLTSWFRASHLPSSSSCLLHTSNTRSSILQARRQGPGAAAAGRALGAAAAAGVGGGGAAAAPRCRGVGCAARAGPARRLQVIFTAMRANR